MGSFFMELENKLKTAVLFLTKKFNVWLSLFLFSNCVIAMINWLQDFLVNLSSGQSFLMSKIADRIG